MRRVGDGRVEEALAWADEYFTHPNVDVLAAALREARAHMTAAYVYLDRFVDVDEALSDGFDLAAWCRKADEMGVKPR